MSFSTDISRSSVLKYQDSTTWDGTSNGGLVPPQAPRQQGSIKNRRSRPSSGTETARKSRKLVVSSRFRHRDHTEASKTEGLVPLPAPRQHGSIGNWRSRPSSGTETARKHRKLEVSSHPRHRDCREASKTGGLVPLQTPRPQGSPENRRSRPASGTETAGKHRKLRSRPASGTETTRKPRKAEVSSRSRHRDHTEEPETGGLVPLQAPRLQGSIENWRSRPASGTETTRKPRKAEVSSRFKHRDHTEASKTEGLVPPQAPRLHGRIENRWSRPSFDTETTRKSRKPKVSSLLRHRDNTEVSKTEGLVPPQTPRPHGSRPASGTETARGQIRKIVLSLCLI